MIYSVRYVCMLPYARLMLHSLRILNCYLLHYLSPEQPLLYLPQYTTFPPNVAVFFDGLA